MSSSTTCLPSSIHCRGSSSSSSTVPHARMCSKGGRRCLNAVQSRLLTPHQAKVSANMTSGFKLLEVWDKADTDTGH